jgi:hypothetical protein
MAFKKGSERSPLVRRQSNPLESSFAAYFWTPGPSAQLMTICADFHYAPNLHFV